MLICLCLGCRIGGSAFLFVYVMLQARTSQAVNIEKFIIKVGGGYADRQKVLINKNPNVRMLVLCMYKMTPIYYFSILLQTV